MQRKTLRPYQSAILGLIRPGRRYLVVVPTGAGKTVLFARLIAEFDGRSVAIAHRKELVSQISRALASEGVEHSLIAPRPTIRMIAAANAAAFGQSYIVNGARATVAGVDSIKTCDARVGLVVQDEAHHALPDNKWGRALELYPKAQVVGFTATAERSDGKGLDGVFEELIIGPSMRELINDGHLSDYRLYAPESTRLDLSEVSVSKKTGDFSAGQLRKTMAAAHITGDVVRHYKQLASGKLGLTFVTDVEAAHEMARAYNEAGVPAAALSAKTPPAERSAMIKRFARCELMQLVNVDLFGEGFDLSSAAGMDVCVECVSMARPTHSFVVFAQQFGRALRLGPGKTHAIIIDHVGNTARHQGPPDFPRIITLEGRKRRSSSGDDDAIKVRVCTECTGVYPRELTVCPYCGHRWTPAERSTPEAVDGNLIELDPATLAELRAKAERAVWGDEPTRDFYARMNIPDVAKAVNVKRQRETRETQMVLREKIAVLAGKWRSEGLADDTIYRRFYLEYGLDVLSACALKAKDARVLMEKMK